MQFRKDKQFQAIPLTNLNIIPANIYLFKFSNINTRKRCELCSKLIIKTPERRHGIVLVFLYLTLNIIHTFLSVFIVDFKQVNVNWDRINPLIHNVPKLSGIF